MPGYSPNGIPTKDWIFSSCRCPTSFIILHLRNFTSSPLLLINIYIIKCIYYITIFINAYLSTSKMDSDFCVSDSGSVCQMLQNITRSMDQPPPSTSSSCPTEQMFKNIRKAARVRTSPVYTSASPPVYTSSPSDVSLLGEDPQQKEPHQHLKQFLQLVNRRETSGTSSDDIEYQPPLSVVEGHLGLALQIERRYEMDIKGKLG